MHGALCIAYSGRCLLSGYFNHRDANQGVCTNACRWEYTVKDGREDALGNVAPAPRLLEEGRRPGELMPIEEDEHGTYLLNSRDLRALEHVGRLVAMGIDSLKIEGRTKSHYYVARTTQAYRRAINDAAAGRPFDVTLLADLENLSNRGYTDGFLQRHPDREYQNYLSSCSTSTRQRFVGELTGFDPDSGLAEVDVRNKFAVGDELELILPHGNTRFRLEHMLDRKGGRIREAPGAGHRVRIPLDRPDWVMGLLARNL